MSVYPSAESNWNSSKKHPILSNGEFSSPTKRSRPSLNQRLGIVDDSDQSDGEPYSPSDDTLLESQQRIIRQPQASLRESTLLASGQPSKAILELLKDDDEDEEDEDEEAYSPSQLDPATMDEVSQQLKAVSEPLPIIPTSYVPPTSASTHQQDVDYREKKKAMENAQPTPCRLIPIHGDSMGVDPRLRIHSARLRSKVRQLVLERLAASEPADRSEVLEEIEHLVESHGRRLYWYRVICFLQNISLTNNTAKQVHYYLKEVSKLLVLTPNISRILRIKQRYPKAIPTETLEDQPLPDPRSKTFAKEDVHLRLLRYK